MLMTVTIIRLHAFEIYNNKVEEKGTTMRHLTLHIPFFNTYRAERQLLVFSEYGHLVQSIDGL